jgi:hypothetical protein
LTSVGHLSLWTCYTLLCCAAGPYGGLELPRGAVIAVCELYDCRPTATEAVPGKRGWSGYVGEKLTYWDLTDQERAFGDYTPGRFAWLLSNVRALPTPIPARGALGLWEWSE